MIDELFDVLLADIPTFSELNKNELITMGQILQSVYVNKDDIIFKEGDTGDNMFILLSGFLSAYGAQADGKQRWLFDIKPGDFFGEMSLIAHEPRSATVYAKTNSILLMLTVVDFFNFIDEYPMISYKILKAISSVQNQWLNQSSKTYSDLIRWGETARKRAITDEMTELYNRRFLEESIKKLFMNSFMNFRIMSLLMIDLDKIHLINDKYGTKAGDLVIIETANVIRSCLRQGDIPARLSGDEFAILLPDTDKNDAYSVAQKIRESMEKMQIKVPSSPGANDNILIKTCVSIGIAITSAHEDTMENFVETADKALRKAKDFGRNRVEIY
jgi:diguanylate cyclase (GGDEF)-like protein